MNQTSSAHGPAGLRPDSTQATPRTPPGLTAVPMTSRLTVESTGAASMGRASVHDSPPSPDTLTTTREVLAWLHAKYTMSRDGPSEASAARQERENNFVLEPHASFTYRGRPNSNPPSRDSITHARRRGRSVRPSPPAAASGARHRHPESQPGVIRPRHEARHGVHPVLALRAAPVRDQHRVVVAVPEREGSGIPGPAAVLRAEHQERIPALRGVRVDAESAEHRAAAARDRDPRIETSPDVEQVLPPRGSVVERHERGAADQRSRGVAPARGAIVHHDRPEQVAWIVGVNGQVRLAQWPAGRVEHDGHARGDPDGLRAKRAGRQEKRGRHQRASGHRDPPHPASAVVCGPPRARASSREVLRRPKEAECVSDPDGDSNECMRSRRLRPFHGRERGDSH